MSKYMCQLNNIMDRSKLQNTFQERLEKFRSGSPEKERFGISSKVLVDGSAQNHNAPRNANSPELKKLKKSPIRGSSASSTKKSGSIHRRKRVLQDISDNVVQTNYSQKRIATKDKNKMGGASLRTFFKSKKSLSKDSKSILNKTSENNKQRLIGKEASSYIEKVKTFLKRENAKTPLKDLGSKINNNSQVDESNSSRNKSPLMKLSPELRTKILGKNLENAFQSSSQSNKENSRRVIQQLASKVAGSPLKSTISYRLESMKLSPSKAGRTYNTYDSFFRLNKTIASQFTALNFIERTGDEIYRIYKTIAKDEDSYEFIRLYADCAQEQEFDQFPKIFFIEKARNLFSRLFKLERWGIITLFYFVVAPPPKQILKLAKLLKRLSEQIWINQNALANWIKELNLSNELDWIINDPKRIYYDVCLEPRDLIEFILDGTRSVLDIISQM